VGLRPKISKQKPKALALHPTSAVIAMRSRDRWGRVPASFIWRGPRQPLGKLD
jgi:hypothetical protein